MVDIGHRHGTRLRKATSAAWRKTYRFDCVPAVGTALTILGILGFTAGRTYTWRYWSEYGASAFQFSFAASDLIYLGYGTNLLNFLWILVAAAFAFLVAAVAMNVSQPLAIAWMNGSKKS